MSDHLHALPQGYRLEEYELEEVLGSGGFGITYLGFDHHLDKAVAIKEYLPSDLAVRQDGTSVVAKSGADREDFEWGLERFLDEARTLARFNHPNLVKVYRFFRAHGTGYIVMEYVEGETLSAYLERVGRLDEGGVRAVIEPLLDGVERIHGSGFLHRDIKPGNIVLRADGTPVLIDFGAARQAVGAKSRSVTSIVTPGYAPIEQYATTGHQGPWTDIYALGAVCYRALTGEPPDDATTRVRHDPLEPAVQAAAGRANPAFLAAVDAALAVDEDRRPQDIAAWKALLDGSAPADSSEVSASRPSPPGASEERRSGPAQDGGADKTRAHWAQVLRNRGSGKRAPAGSATTGAGGGKRWLPIMGGTVVLLGIVGSVSIVIDNGRAPSPPVQEPTPPVPESTAEADPEEPSAVDPNADRIAELKAEFETQLANNKLTLPAGDNAADTLSEIESIDGEHPFVAAGRKRIGEAYLTLASRSISSQSWANAETYLNKAEQFIPDSDALFNLARRLENARNAAAEAERQEEIAQKIQRIGLTIRQKDFRTANRLIDEIEELGAGATRVSELRRQLASAQEEERERCSETIVEWQSGEKRWPGAYSWGEGRTRYRAKQRALDRLDYDERPDRRFCEEYDQEDLWRSIDTRIEEDLDCVQKFDPRGFYFYSCDYEYDYICTFRERIETSPPGCR